MRSKLLLHAGGVLALSRGLDHQGGPAGAPGRRARRWARRPGAAGQRLPPAPGGGGGGVGLPLPAPRGPPAPRRAGGGHLRPHPGPAAGERLARGAGAARPAPRRAPPGREAGAQLPPQSGSGRGGGRLLGTGAGGPGHAPGPGSGLRSARRDPRAPGAGGRRPHGHPLRAAAALAPRPTTRRPLAGFLELYLVAGWLAVTVLSQTRPRSGHPRRHPAPLLRPPLPGGARGGGPVGGPRAVAAGGRPPGLPRKASTTSS